MRASANGIELEYETFGDPSGDPLLLVMGLGCQLTVWDEALCRLLADRGFLVLRYDNRDVGLSTHCDAAGTQDLRELLVAAAEGRASAIAYSLNAIS